MGYQLVLRVSRLHSERLGAMTLHNDRTRGEVELAQKKDICAFEGVDLTKTRRNVVLRGTGSVSVDVHNANKGLCGTQKRAPVAADCIVSVNPAFFEKMDDAQIKDWGNTATQCVEDYLNAQNMGSDGLLSSILHLDERTPHLHIVMSVRTTEFKKKNKKQPPCLSYSAYFNDSKTIIAAARAAQTVDTETKLGRMQTDIAERLALRGYDIERGIRNSRAVHRHQHKYHTENAEKETKKAQRDARLAEEAQKTAFYVEQAAASRIAAAQGAAHNADEQAQKAQSKARDDEKQIKAATEEAYFKLARARDAAQAAEERLQRLIKTEDAAKKAEIALSNSLSRLKKVKAVLKRHESRLNELARKIEFFAPKKDDKIWAEAREAARDASADVTEVIKPEEEEKNYTEEHHQTNFFRF